MGIIRKLFTWGGLAVTILLIVAFIRPMYRLGEASIAGKKAPDFALTLAEKPMHLSDLRGKVVVLNFWATWCPPCVEETPALNRLQQRIASWGGLVLGVSVDEDQSAYERFLKQQGVAFSTFRDPSRKISLDYGTSLYPETYILDHNGKIARKVIGPQQWDSPEMLAYLDSLLGKS